MSQQPVTLDLALKHPRAERRVCVRYHASQDVISRPLQESGGIAWGAEVQSISTGGIGLSLCYPFKPDTLVAVDLHGKSGPLTLLAQVVHVSDQASGSWTVGCAFIHPLSEEQLEDLL